MPFSTRKILLVEDHPDTMEMMQRQVQHIGFGAVLMARSGDEAVRIAEAERPDLVLMDIILPGMDGLEATRRIKSNPTTAEIPILATTAKAMSGDRDLCLQNGCDGYLPKPISLEQLTQAIEELLSPRSSK
jgi:CheY-like chemotaxis protein